MTGLLSQFAEFAKSPEGQGLLSAAFGGLAGAQRGAPLNSIGRAGLAGLAGYSGALDRQDQQANAQFQNQYRTMQMDAIKQQQEKQKAEQAWRQKLPELMAPKLQGETEQSRMLLDQMGPDATPDDVLAMNQGARMPAMGFEYGVDKTALQKHIMDPASPFADEVLKKQLFPGEKKYLTVGGAVIDPETMKPVYTTPEKINPNQPFLLVDGKVVPNMEYQKYEKEKAAAGATRVSQSVGGPQILPTKFTDEIDKLGARNLMDQYGEARNAATAISAAKDVISLLDQGAFTGKLGPAKEQLAAWYQAATGADIPQLDASQQLKTVIGDIVLPALSNLKGASSDRDFIKIEEYSRGESTMTETALRGHMQRLMNKYGGQVKAYNSQYDLYKQQRPDVNLPGIGRIDEPGGNFKKPKPEKSGAPANIPQAAINELKMRKGDPAARQQFDAVFGAGAAARVLGGQ